jgi:segregation and condensation protein A
VNGELRLSSLVTALHHIAVIRDLRWCAMGYEVQTPAFEGPFDLLLHLILKQEVDLWEISLGPIVDEYLARVEALEHVDLDVATEFLLIAATLVELKARRLLPSPEPIDLDEELARWEERDYLLARLLECKTFQDAAHTIHERMTIASHTFGRLAGPEHPFCLLSPDPLERVSLEQLAKAAAKGLAPRPELSVRTDADHITVARVSVREAIEAVLALLPAREPVPFRDLVRDVSSKIEAIVRFLACLELFKQGMVDLDQCENFGELQVRMLAPGETAELDLESLAEWGDEDAAPALAAVDQ